MRDTCPLTMLRRAADCCVFGMKVNTIVTTGPCVFVIAEFLEAKLLVRNEITSTVEQNTKRSKKTIPPRLLFRGTWGASWAEGEITYCDRSFGNGRAESSVGSTDTTRMTCRTWHSSCQRLLRN